MYTQDKGPGLPQDAPYNTTHLCALSTAMRESGSNSSIDPSSARHQHHNRVEQQHARMMQQVVQQVWCGVECGKVLQRLATRS